MPSEREYLRACLAEVYTPEGCDIWMRSPNRLLDGRSPDDLIAAGEADRVLALITALAEGVMD